MTIPAALLYTQPAPIDIQITQGDDWSDRFDVLDGSGVAVNLTGLTASAKIKDAFGGTLLATITCAITTPANGQISVSLAAAATGALTIPGAATNIRSGLVGYYDLQVTDGSLIVTLAGGQVTLWREITTP